MAPPKGYKQTAAHKAAVQAGRRAAQGQPPVVSPDGARRRREGARKGGLARWAKHHTATDASTTRTKVARVPRSPDPTPSHDEETHQQVHAQDLHDAYVLGEVTALLRHYACDAGIPYGPLTQRVAELLHARARGAVRRAPRALSPV